HPPHTYTLSLHDALPIYEVHTQAQASPPANANDFVELFNKSAQAIDISGLVISYRAGGASPNTLTLPASTVIPAGGYLIIVNGADRKSTRLNSSHLGISY